MDYFEQLPLVQYDGKIATNIMTALRLDDLTDSQLVDYTIDEGEFADSVAHNFYGDSRMVWSIYLVNKMLNPYFDWPMSETDFENYIIDKYGSWRDASVRIIHYRNNWRSNRESRLTPSAYAALPSHLKRYWEAVLNDYQQPVEYKRLELDTTYETNKIIRLDVDSIDFLSSERVTQSSGGTITAAGEVCYVGDTFIYVRHVSGTFTATTLTGETSENTATVSAVELIVQPIDDDLTPYFESVSALDDESDRQQRLRQIKLISRTYIETVKRALRDL